MEPILALAFTIPAILGALVDVIPVVNVIKDVVGAVNGTAPDPSWWAFALKMAWSTTCLQIAMPYLERLTRSTANTWDDGIVAKTKMVLAFVVEILGAVGAFDPKLGKRLKAIVGPRS